MGIYQPAIIIGLLILAAAIGFALIPEVLDRMPRRRRRHEQHLLKPSEEEDESRRRPRPRLKREATRDTNGPPASDPG